MEKIIVAAFRTKKGPSLVEAYEDKQKAVDEAPVGSTLLELDVFDTRPGAVQVDSLDGFRQWVEVVG